MHNPLLNAAGSPLQPWGDGLAFEGEDSEDALMDQAEGLLAGEALQGLDADGKLAEGERPLAGHGSDAKALQVFGRRVLGPIDNAQVFASTTLDGRRSR